MKNPIFVASAAIHKAAQRAQDEKVLAATREAIRSSKEFFTKHVPTTLSKPRVLTPPSGRGNQRCPIECWDRLQPLSLDVPHRQRGSEAQIDAESATSSSEI